MYTGSIPVLASKDFPTKTSHQAVEHGEKLLPERASRFADNFIATKMPPEGGILF